MIRSDQSQGHNLVFQMSQRASQVNSDKQDESKNDLIKQKQTKQLTIQQKPQVAINPQKTIESNPLQTAGSGQIVINKKNSSKLLLKQKDRYEIKTLQRGMFANSEQSVNQLKIIYTDSSPSIRKQESTQSLRRRKPIKLSPLQNASGVKIISQEQINQKSQNYSLSNSISLKPISVTPVRVKQITEIKYFVQQAISPHKKFIGILKRNRSGTKKFFPQYDLFFNQQVKFVLSSKRKSCFCTSTYYIGTNKQYVQETDNEYTATVKSNFLGSEFNVYNNSNGQFQLLATIIFISQITCKQTPRSLQVYILSPFFKYSDLDGSQLGMSKSLKQLYEIGTNKENKKILKLINKKPVWDTRRQSWCLDFHGKALYSSVKNMILVSSQDEKKQSLLLAKAGDDIFNMDIMFPLSPRVAVAIANAGFDWKWVSQ